MAQRTVGLDIGTSAIRAVELTVSDSGPPVLEAYGQVGIPPGAVVDGEIRDRLGISQAIERLWREGGFTEKKVLIGIAGLRAITRELDMPNLPPEELNDAVRFQADEVVPFPLEKTAISSKVIAQYTDAEGAPTLRVLLAAAHRDLIDALIDTVQQAGLEPVGIDLNTAALVRALYDPSTGEGPEAIVSVGAGLTMVVVHQAGVLQFVRTIDLGGESITKSIASALDIPLSDAEAIKRRLSDPDMAGDRAQPAAQQAVDELVNEIHNSIRFFASLPGRSPVTRLLVSGGGARTVGFFERLERGMDVPVVPASPLARVDTSRLPISHEQEAAIDPTLAVPVGLALPDPTGNPFNLLPKEVTQRLAEQRVSRGLVVAGIAVAIVLLGLSAWKVLDAHNASDRESGLMASVNNLKFVVIPKYNKVVKLQNEVAARQKELTPTLANQIDLLVVFNQISLWQTSTATLTGITITATPPTATTSGTSGTLGSSSTSSKTSSASATAAVLGTFTTTVQVPTLTDVTAWGTSMIQSPAFGAVLPGPISQQSGSGGTTGYEFPASGVITSAAVSYRLATIIQGLP